MKKHQSFNMAKHYSTKLPSGEIFTRYCETIWEFCAHVNSKLDSGYRATIVKNNVKIVKC